MAEAVAEVFGGVFLALPVHAGGLGVVDLHAVHADVALAGFGITRDDARESDEWAAVLRPGFEDGKVEEVDVLTPMDHLFAGSVLGGDDFGEVVSYLSEHGEHLHLVHEGGGGLLLEECADAIGDGIEGVGFEREAHTAFAAELVHEDACARMALYVFEEESWASRFGCAAMEFGGAVRDLGHLEVGVHLGGDAFELTGFLEGLDPVA